MIAAEPDLAGAQTWTLTDGSPPAAEPEPVIRVDSLRRIEAVPGDRFVLTLPTRTTELECARIHHMWEQFMPGYPLMTVPEGFELSLVRPD